MDMYLKEFHFSSPLNQLIHRQEHYKDYLVAHLMITFILQILRKGTLLKPQKDMHLKILLVLYKHHLFQDLYLFIDYLTQILMTTSIQPI